MERKITPLKYERIIRGVTQMELTRKTGLCNSMISAIERGRYVPSETHKQTLAEALGVSIKKLFPKGE